MPVPEPIDILQGNFRQCPQCGQLDWMHTHRCPPRWECSFDPTDGSGWCEIWAPTGQEAAQRFVAHWDSDVSELTEHVSVWVRAAKCDPVKWEVVGTLVPVYEAERAEEQEPPEFPPYTDAQGREHAEY